MQSRGGVDHTPLSSVEVKGRIELHPYIFMTNYSYISTAVHSLC